MLDLLELDSLDLHDVCWMIDHKGYCGEMSFQSVMLFFGAYVTEEQFNLVGGGELLIGVNAAKVAETFKLKYEMWPYETAPQPQVFDFLDWVKDYLDQGVPVVSGFFGDDGSSPDYDHIMPIIGYKNAEGLLDGIYYNDLEHIEVQLTTNSLNTTRGAWKNGSAYTLYSLPTYVNYGIALLGNKNPGIPVQFLASSNREPDYGREDKIYAQPVPINGTLVVSALSAGYSYTCVRFDSLAALPDNSDFLNANYAMRHDFIATDSTYSLFYSDGMFSNGTYFFRCVCTSKSDMTVNPGVIAAIVVAGVLLVSFAGFLCYQRIKKYEYASLVENAPRFG